ncbi:unnamed protein product [Chondrus crispus]|uniref:Uncharacterized protein n=1 Tax=Chondrus crispus TaxID=2769 RepID=R7QKS1_CHOCR|nr:unnamed protein product [Chondrus crispus]CDF38071.1 unnamed protein product [Chondrus crispus]|eukprot:XP_005717940.1 unnamed protein product [Chondrus crispus]
MHPSIICATTLVQDLTSRRVLFVCYVQISSLQHNSFLCQSTKGFARMRPLFNCNLEFNIAKKQTLKQPCVWSYFVIVGCKPNLCGSFVLIRMICGQTRDCHPKLLNTLEDFGDLGCYKRSSSSPHQAQPPHLISFLSN